jgi:hypothetical protein
MILSKAGVGYITADDEEKWTWKEADLASFR